MLNFQNKILYIEMTHKPHLQTWSNSCSIESIRSEILTKPENQQPPNVYNLQNNIKPDRKEVFSKPDKPY